MMYKYVPMRTVKEKEQLLNATDGSLLQAWC